MNDSISFTSFTSGMKQETSTSQPYNNPSDMACGQESPAWANEYNSRFKNNESGGQHAALALCRFTENVLKGAAWQYPGRKTDAAPFFCPHHGSWLQLYLTYRQPICYNPVSSPEHIRVRNPLRDHSSGKQIGSGNEIHD